MALLFGKKRTVLKTLQTIRDKCREIINRNEEIGELIEQMSSSTPLPCKIIVLIFVDFWSFRGETDNPDDNNTFTYTLNDPQLKLSLNFNPLLVSYSLLLINLVEASSPS